MLKELFVTSLLSFSVGSVPLKMHSNNLNNNGVYSLQGAYCLRDVIGNDMGAGYYDRVGDELYTYYDYNDYNEGAVDIYAYFFFTNDFITVRQLDIYCAMDTIDTYAMFNLHINLGEETIYQTNMVTGDNISNFSYDVQSVIVYFPRAYYVTQDEYNCFISLFTGNGNSYVHNYSGYYSFVNTGRVGDFEFYGNVMSLLYGDDFKGKTSLKDSNSFRALFIRYLFIEYV